MDAPAENWDPTPASELTNKTGEKITLSLDVEQQKKWHVATRWSIFNPLTCMCFIEWGRFKKRWYHFRGSFSDGQDWFG